MLKLYKRIDGVLHYHEAWLDDNTINEHWGIAGESGKTKEHLLPNGKSEETAIPDVLRPAIDAGYRPIDIEDHATLLIEYTVDRMGTGDDVKKRYALQDRMNETLGWRGLGACDGGSIGSGTMEVCCFVVDFDVAKHVIAADLAGTEFSDFARIYNEDAEE
jgi:hypothetical protein